MAGRHEAAGSRVFDLGYQRYTGPRQGRNRARWALFVNGLRTLLGIGRGGKAKILPALFFFAVMIPALCSSSFLPSSATWSKRRKRATSYRAPPTTTALWPWWWLLFGAIMAPELLGPDRRDNVLPLYLVRPLTTLDYLGMRLAALAVIVLVLVYSGRRS